ncbi:MAG: hypothetical protein HQK78_18435, partial [Desulfobacterales bacterium]|nr:hypothetical protein [Desulfobacterales bacterium]
SYLALWGIYRATKGYPRKIINLCHQCLLAMIIQNRIMVDWFMVRSCANRSLIYKEKKKFDLLRFVLLPIFALFIFMMIYNNNIVFDLINFRKANKNEIKKTELPILEQEKKTIKSFVKEPFNAKLYSFTSLIENDLSTDFFAFWENEKKRENIKIKRPEKLGDISIKPGETLGELIHRIYGEFNPILLKAVLNLNPNVHYVNQVQINETIIFPAIIAKVQPVSKKAFWIEIDRKYSLIEAIDFFRFFPKGLPPVRLIPYWNKEEGLVFSVVLKEYFFDEYKAKIKLQEMPDIFSLKKKVVSLWNGDNLYFADPFYLPGTITTAYLRESRN